MAAQLYLFEDYLSCKKVKRIRYAIPHYKKVYSVYQYDQAKYMEIWKKIRDLAIRLNRPEIFFKLSPYKVLKHCYIRDNGEKVYTGDEQHIFRIKTLYSILSNIFNYSRTPVNLTAASELQWERHGVLFFYDHIDGGYAEVKGTGDLPIKERLIIHIRLLRLLRKGTEFRKAVRLCQMRPLR